VNNKTDSRAFILVLDGFGIGFAPDAADFGDQGAVTLGHIAEACLMGRADRTGVRKGPLHLPFLEALGLGEAAKLASTQRPSGFSSILPEGKYAACRESGSGKDTTSGHWEMAGVPVSFDWDYFPETPSFPGPLNDSLARKANLPGILGNCHASGTEIIKRLGDEHLTSGKPIFYTSIDSVFQIAAHEEHFGLKRLYDLCLLARTTLDKSSLNIARVIARPFIGKTGNYVVDTENQANGPGKEI